MQNKVQMKNIENQIKQKVEEANLNMVKNLIEMGLNQDSTEIPFEKVKTFLSLKVEEIDDISDLQKIEKLESLITQYKQRINGLKKQEQDFNDNVQVVVESDEKQILINEKMTEAKNKIQELSN